MLLKITTAAGVKTFSNQLNSVVVSAANKITDISYGVTPTTVAGIAAYDASNTKYELGHLTEGGYFSAIYSN